jgi:serine/threonine protein kinase
MPELVKTVGRYGILRELGRGGMAVVYLARQVDLNRLVALKELAAFHAADPAFAQRFVRESQLAGSLVHPNVITVFDYFEHEGTPYIAMEYVERGSLRPYVGQMTLAQIGGVLEGLLAGLSAAEERAIVHRDLKPENLMVTSDGGVKIADFGIAKATQASGTGAFVTATGTTVGTPPYMAPEQAMAGNVGPWTDLYSVGCMAYELFTGRPPFHDSPEPLAILLRHINEPLTPAREAAAVDSDISEWIERLTAKDPGERPQSATAAREDLEEILLGKLGPRWRRESRLPEPPGGAAGGTSMEGIDLEGTGPDTGQPLPAAETPPDRTIGESGYRTYVTPPSEPPPAEAPPDLGATPIDAPAPAGPESEARSAPVTAAAAQPPPATEQPAAVAPAPADRDRPQGPSEPPAVRAGAASAASERVALLARAGGGAVLAALAIAVLAPGHTRWDLFAVLSPFEAAGIAIATWGAARALSTARISPAVAAGVLIGFGVLTAVAALALIRFAVNRLETPSTVLAFVVLLGAGALLAAGITCLRGASRDEAATPVDPATLVLGLAGTALAGAAIFVRYDGFSSLWTELVERESAEFFFEPMIAVVVMLAGLLLSGGRPRLACGLLLAAGSAAALHFLGLIVAAWRAIGEVGEIRAAGFIGLLGGLLVLAAGVRAHQRPERRPISPRP